MVFFVEFDCCQVTLHQEVGYSCWTLGFQKRKWTSLLSPNVNYVLHQTTFEIKKITQTTRNIFKCNFTIQKTIN